MIPTSLIGSKDPYHGEYLTQFVGRNLLQDKETTANVYMYLLYELQNILSCHPGPLQGYYVTVTVMICYH